MEGQEELVQAGRAGVFLGEDARDPGQFGAHRLRPVTVQHRLERVQAGADPPGRAAQRARRLDGVLRRGRARAGLPVQAQRSEELGRPGPQIAGQGVRRYGTGRRIKVSLCHAGASGRQ
ncbi:hypothetical protein SHKM778_91180 [Streptomyces sp. KM77-8]|uniref:Uncharacterized protein n=1 Tax=Streptomyces haneummycinicus TaxID=3074435 RepID=A0AAT9HZR3_9ACTN